MEQAPEKKFFFDRNQKGKKKMIKKIENAVFKSLKILRIVSEVCTRRPHSQNDRRAAQEERIGIRA